MKRKLLLWALLLMPWLAQASYQPRFSTAGFYEVPGTGRTAYSMNPAWRFHKGHADGAERPDYDDSAWPAVSLPHGIERLPMEASGCVNYQGEAWYRKHFTVDAAWKGQRLMLHFEGIMGKSKVWVNGRLLTTHLGGFLPVIADISDAVRYGADNVITVMADNSDDPSYPPGKAQDVLDFTYCGGIYRDCWLVKTGKTFITDANEENLTAGGGVLVSYGKVSEELTEMRVDVSLRNQAGKTFRGRLHLELHDRDGRRVWADSSRVSISSGRLGKTVSQARLRDVSLWSPDSPTLYRLYVRLQDHDGRTVDGYYIRLGLRSIEFKGEDGFWLNGKPYAEPLIGANRHQEFAVIGNALPNSLHWRDAKKLRDAGLRVIRNAHYPQDPAFMDACDELGLFVIENTPGWQFWNSDPAFAQHVYSDIRNIVRRDRNRPSVWLYEPILNETSYPDDFAKTARAVVHEEFPFAYCYAACDRSARGSSHFDVQFTHPQTGDPGYAIKNLDPKKTYFTREWGDNVDDWNSHNSPSRASRAWGEQAMLVQAQGYARPDYDYTCYDALYRTTRQHVGGCLWHSFDHQRGYHPDPFYGGIMDNFRQPKLSYHMFTAQRPNRPNPNLMADNGPMVYIAHAMTPFSPADVTVYSNCDSVRLTCGRNGRVLTHVNRHEAGMPSPVITFKDAFHVMDDKERSRRGRQADSYLLAEGYVDGRLVASHKVTPARRPTRIRLTVDDEGTPLHADGSDMVTVVAAITDDQGNVKRLNNERILFTVEGEGRIVGDAQSFTNPVAVQWGTAPVLVQATTRPGRIVVRAAVVWQGKTTPLEGTVEIVSRKPQQPLLASPKEVEAIAASPATIRPQGAPSATTDPERLKEVEKQQADFEF